MNKQTTLDFEEQHQYSHRSTYVPKEIGLSLNGSQISRPIHYLGSKLRLTSVISTMIDQVDPSQGTVCDLFAGSGTVSKALSSR